MMARLRLDLLLGKRVYRHFNQFFLLAWDEQSQNLVCFAVMNHYDRLINWRLRTQAQRVAEAEACIDKLAGRDGESVYLCGLMYISSSGTPNDAAWPMGVQRITPDEYAAVVAEAQS